MAKGDGPLARAGVVAAEARRDGTEATLWIAFVKAWYGYAVTKNVVGIQTQVVIAARDREASLKRLFAAGRATELAFSAVTLKRAEAEQRLLEAQTAAANAGYGLEALVGEPVHQSKVDVVAAARARMSMVPATGRAADVRLAEAGAKAAAARAGVAKGALFPKVGLRVGAQYANPNTRYFPIKDDWRSSWDASIVLTWNLDAGVKWHEAKRATLEAEAARSNAQALELQRSVELTQALTSVKLIAARLDVAAERIRVAQRAVTAAENAQREGRTTAADVLERVADLGLARAAEQSVALADIINAEKARTLAGEAGLR